MSIGMLTATCCSDVQSKGGQTLKEVLEKKTMATKGDNDATRACLLNEALQSIAEADKEAGRVAQVPGDLAWMDISKAVLESEAFKEQACFPSEYLGYRGGMKQWWDKLKKTRIGTSTIWSIFIMRSAYNTSVGRTKDQKAGCKS